MLDITTDPRGGELIDAIATPDISEFSREFVQAEYDRMGRQIYDRIVQDCTEAGYSQADFLLSSKSADFDSLVMGAQLMFGDHFKAAVTSPLNMNGDQYFIVWHTDESYSDQGIDSV